LYQISGDYSFYCDWWWWYISYNPIKDYTGTIYCRFYTQTYYVEIYPTNDSKPYDVRMETMGKPSEVFSFTIAGITRDL
jgi:hypothetical protein